MKGGIILFIIIAVGIWFFVDRPVDNGEDKTIDVAEDTSSTENVQNALPINRSKTDTGETAVTTEEALPENTDDDNLISNDIDKEDKETETASSQSPEVEEPVEEAATPTQVPEASEPVEEIATVIEEPIVIPVYEKPTVELGASDIIINNGEELTLTWDAKNADSCKSSGFLIYGEMSGEMKFNPSLSNTYTLTCSNKGGEVKESVEVTVASSLGPAVTLRASAVDIDSTESITLTWGSINASNCSGTEFTANKTSGTVELSPNVTTRYRLVCTNSTTGATAETSVLVRVVYVDENIALDVTPPKLSGGAPTTTIVSTTTTIVMLSVETDEKATCKYSNTTGLLYANMTSFGGNKTTAHAVKISGLLPFSTYRYYVRCEDEEGNQNTADYLIQFSIADG